MFLVNKEINKKFRSFERSELESHYAQYPNHATHVTRMACEARHALINSLMSLAHSCHQWDGPIHARTVSRTVSSRLQAQNFVICDACVQAPCAHSFRNTFRFFVITNKSFLFN